MFIHNLNPVFLDLGFLQIRYYGLVYFFGFLFIYLFLKSQVKKGQIKGMDNELLDTFLVYTFLGMLIGARIFTYFFYYPQVFINDPLVLFKIWQGGMAFHGGLFGAIVGGYLFTKKYRLNFYELADKLVIPAAIFLFIGRIANFINAELPGTVSNARWCVVYPGEEVCRHPYVLYEGIKNLFLGVGLYITSVTKELKPGVLFWWFVLLYNLLRFFIDFYRQDAIVGQVLSVIFIIVSAYFIIKGDFK